MATKTCPRCRRALSLSAYTNGRLSPYCRPCKAAFNREYRARNLDRERERQREWMRERRQQDPTYIEAIRDWQRHNPQRVAAHQAVYRAKQRGDLVPAAACEVCGTTDRRLDAHHDDYSLPLDVRWVCRPCHSRL